MIVSPGRVSRERPSEAESGSGLSDRSQVFGSGPLRGRGEATGAVE